MMRHLLAAAICAAVALTALVPQASAAITKEEEQKILILKKKKAAAAKVAAEKRIMEAEAKVNALKKLQARKIAMAKKAQEREKKQVAKRRSCGGFMECLFGKRQGVRVSRGSNSGLQYASLSTRSKRKTVDWDDPKYPVGSLIVKTPERALYYIKGDGEAIRYSIGVGREGFQWSGSSSIVSKQEWPSWTPPKTMIEREAAKGHYIPDFMEGGPGNPLGARAMYIGGTIYRVHGTNNEASIGGAVSSGCIRMMNADVIDLYERVKIGAKIYVYQ